MCGSWRAINLVDLWRSRSNIQPKSLSNYVEQQTNEELCAQQKRQTKNVPIIQLDDAIFVIFDLLDQIERRPFSQTRENDLLPQLIISSWCDFWR